MGLTFVSSEYYSVVSTKDRKRVRFQKHLRHIPHQVLEWLCNNQGLQRFCGYSWIEISRAHMSYISTKPEKHFNMVIVSGTCGVVVLVNLLDSWESSSTFKLRVWLCVKHKVEQMRRNVATKI